MRKGTSTGKSSSQSSSKHSRGRNIESFIASSSAAGGEGGGRLMAALASLGSVCGGGLDSGDPIL